MNGESLDIKPTRLQKLKEIFPELFAENQLDWEKLKAAFGEDINFANERQWKISLRKIGKRLNNPTLIISFC